MPVHTKLDWKHLYHGYVVAGCNLATYIIVAVVVKDVDECILSGTNNCQQVCLNDPGSFTCSCNTGYMLGADGFTCVG